VKERKRGRERIKMIEEMDHISLLLRGSSVEEKIAGYG
jgi:hypothetical protein